MKLENPKIPGIQPYEPYILTFSGEIRSCVTQKLNDEMKLIVATDQWETEAFDWPGLSEDSEHSLFRFAADIRSEVNRGQMSYDRNTEC